jgi:hypothetical protein
MRDTGCTKIPTGYYMSKPDLKGLTKLAGYLQKVPRKQFDMNEWWYDNNCGSAGCILGHASFAFPSRFKRLHDKYDYSKPYYIQHRASGNLSEQAFAAAFRVNEGDASELVFSPGISTPRQAAKAVRGLISKLEREMKVGK